DSIKAYVQFWEDVFDAADSSGGSVAADEALYRLFQWATVELMKFEEPGIYALMRLLGVFTYDVRTAIEETFAPEGAGNIFTADYWRSMPPALKHGYLNFRLDQAPDFVLGDPDTAATEAERVRLRQLDEHVFGWSDIGFFGFAFLFLLRKWTIGDRV